MKEEIIIAGFGGQGVLSMGKILAYSGLMENKEVTWMPAYGPEQRGGTANVTVIVSDERISSPILSKYDTAIILNQPSLAKFENKIKPGGVLIYDGYGIINPPTRKDIHDSGFTLKDNYIADFDNSFKTGNDMTVDESTDSSNLK